MKNMSHCTVSLWSTGGVI